MCNRVLFQVDCKKGPDSDKTAFAAFVRELTAAFRPKGYLLTSAVSPSKVVIDAGVCQVKDVIRVVVLILYTRTKETLLYLQPATSIK